MKRRDRTPRSHAEADKGISNEAALEQARLRWPNLNAFAERHWSDYYSPCRVGYVRNEGKGWKRVIVGRGLTWERAFLSADKRESAKPRPKRARRAKRVKGPKLEQLEIPFEGAHGRATTEG